MDSESEARRRWVACLLANELDAGRDRQDAQKRVAARIRHILDSGPTHGFPIDWYRVLLNSDGELRASYNRSQLPDKTARILATKDQPDIPPAT